jgi:hypothetical protein
MLQVKLDGKIVVPTMTGEAEKLAVVDQAGKRYALVQKGAQLRAWSGDTNENAVDCAVVDELPPALGEIFETTLPSGKFDSAGREIGYTVGLRDNGVDFYAWVQNARRVKGEWKDFGVAQRSKKFGSQVEANRWAYATAKERIAKLA